MTNEAGFQPAALRGQRHGGSFRVAALLDVDLVLQRGGGHL
jgi:hypothetical protein